MLRKLLTLAAVLTGLAAIAAPAEARIAAVEHVRIAASGEQVAQGQAQAPAYVAGPLNAAIARDSASLASPRIAFELAVPTVRTGIDRARE
jgi:hypothetical protein